MKKQFHNKRHFYISIDPFKIDILFAINTTGDETMTYLKKTADKNKLKTFPVSIKGWENVNAQGRMISFCGGFIVLLKADKNDFRGFVGVLAHEVTHVVHYMLRDRRIRLNSGTEEVYTYHIENLIVKVLREVY